MKNFNLSVSFDAFTAKPTEQEYIEMVFRQRNLNTNDLYDLIQKGHVFCHNFSRRTFMSFYTLEKNFTSANLIVFDIDHSPLSLNTVINDILIKPTIAYETLRNCQDDFRFKLIYLLDKPITKKEDYRRYSELFFKKIFTDEILTVIQPDLDKTCYSATQLFVGTNKNKMIVLNDTIITMDFLDEISKDYLLEKNVRKRKDTQSVNSSNNSTTLNISTKNEHQSKYPISPPDLNMNSTFGTTVKNSIYSVNPFNNFFNADIADRSMVYYYVADQNIYSLSTYMKNGKVQIGKRHQTMKYHMFVLKNMYPNITISEMFNKIRWLVNTYYIRPSEINDKEIIRMSNSILNLKLNTDTGKRKYILNPDYTYLTKSEKIKKFQNCKSVHSKNEILASADLRKNYVEIAAELGYSPATVKKYLKNEGIDLVQMKKTEKYEMFRNTYNAPENLGKSQRELAEITGISKSQIGRYITRLKNE